MKKLINTIVLLIVIISAVAQTNSLLSYDPTWPNAANVRIAFEDMRKNKDYDVAKYESKVKELEELCSRGFEGIEQGNAEVMLRAERAVSLKREILMSNPLLDGDRIRIINIVSLKSFLIL